MKIRFFMVLLGFSVAFDSAAALIEKEIRYKHDDTVMFGFVVYDDAIKGKRPGVLVVHEWWGHNSFARNRAIELARSGYTAIAIDMYGDGQTADHPKDASKFSSAVSGNLNLAKARFESAIITLKQQDTVEADNIAALGYCFGGGILLNMARMGIDIDGVVSFHGSLATRNPAEKGQIKTRIRVFNGADDTFVKAEHITAFKQEMDASGADYQFINYPGAVHSFTNPGATEVGKKFGLPLAYNEAADKDSWSQTLLFLEQIFKQ